MGYTLFFSLFKHLVYSPFTVGDKKTCTDLVRTDYNIPELCKNNSKSNRYETCHNKPGIMHIDEDRFEELYAMMVKRFDHIDHKLERMNKVNSCLDGDKLLDNQDMCELLGVTKRTLARYRQKKLVGYYMIDGRTYYRSSEIQEFLKRKGRQP
jgi:hypothetical protein